MELNSLHSEFELKEFGPTTNSRPSCDRLESSMIQGVGWLFDPLGRIDRDENIISCPRLWQWGGVCANWILLDQKSL